MKNLKFMLCLVSLLAGLTAASASEDARKPQADKSTLPRKEKPAVQKVTPRDQTEMNVALTGSYIKRTVKRNGRITGGPSPVIVINRETIERSGAVDLRQLLTQQGFAR